MPEGFYEDMLSDLREKRAAGVSEERLAFLIATAEDVEDCSEDTATKRFLVRTPISQGANDSIAFGDGALTLTVTALGGAESVAEGLLPLHHAVIEDGREYRFTARAGARGFLEVTGTSCAFP